MRAQDSDIHPLCGCPSSSRSCKHWTSASLRCAVSLSLCNFGMGPTALVCFCPSCPSCVLDCLCPLSCWVWCIYQRVCTAGQAAERLRDWSCTPKQRRIDQRCPNGTFAYFWQPTWGGLISTPNQWIHSCCFHGSFFCFLSTPANDVR